MMPRDSLALVAAFLLLMCALGPAGACTSCTWAGATGQTCALNRCCYACTSMAWDGVRVKADGQVECYHSVGLGTGDAPTGNNGSSTCVGSATAPSPSPSPAPGTSPAGTGMDTEHTNPAVASCLKTGTIADCAYIGLCKNDNDFMPDLTSTGAAANCKGGVQYLLSKFQEAEVWADVTCSDIESKTYQDAGSTETKMMADTLEGWSSGCCGGKDKMRLPCSELASESLAPGLAVNPTWSLVLSVSTLLLQVLSGW